MSSRIVSLRAFACLTLGVLSGCPTRPLPAAVSDAAAGATTSPRHVDANADTTTTNITVRTDAGTAAVDSGPSDVAIVSDGAAGATTSPQDVDANADTTTTNITIPADEGDAAADSGPGDAAMDSDSDSDFESEQPKLPPPPLSDVGASCPVNAQGASGIGRTPDEPIFEIHARSRVRLRIAFADLRSHRSAT